MEPATLFDRLNDTELLSVARHHQDKFNRAWSVVMRTHYRTGQHIDAHDTMEREYKVLGQIGQYIYNSRPHTVYKEWLQLNVGTVYR